MDLTLQYIIKCEKATELQKYPIVPGDYYTSRRSLYVWDFTEDEIVGAYLKPKLEMYPGIPEIRPCLIKLFRQDRLQDMVIGKIDSWPTGVIGLHNLTYFAEEHEWESMEQLWLAFVMFHLYHKIWINYKSDWEIVDV